MAASDTPWGNFSPSDYSPQQWQRACLIDIEQGPPESRDRFKLAVREPSNTVNRNAVHQAAQKLKDMPDVTLEKRIGAARKLISLFRTDLGENPPDELVNMIEGGERSAPPLVERHWATQWLKIAPMEVRNIEGGKASRTIGGYASVFEKRSQPLGGFVEIVERSFFNKSRADGWPGVVCRYNHSDMALLGTTHAQTLRLSQDNVGLDYVVDLPESRGDVLELVQRKDITNSSFAFQVFDQDWTHDEGYPVRHLTSGKLIDVAPVTIPAYPDATVGLRSLADRMNAAIEDVLNLSERNELRQLFIRTDNRGPSKANVKTKSGREALLETMKMASQTA